MSSSALPESLTSPREAAPLAPRPSFSDNPNAVPPSPEVSGDILVDVISNGAFSKTWVLPPRKKPGRKAANDVPPTVLRSLSFTVDGRNDKLKIGLRKRLSGIGKR